MVERSAPSLSPTPAHAPDSCFVKSLNPKLLLNPMLPPDQAIVDNPYPVPTQHEPVTLVPLVTNLSELSLVIPGQNNSTRDPLANEHGSAELAA